MKATSGTVTACLRASPIAFELSAGRFDGLLPPSKRPPRTIDYASLHLSRNDDVYSSHNDRHPAGGHRRVDYCGYSRSPSHRHNDGDRSDFAAGCLGRTVAAVKFSQSKMKRQGISDSLADIIIGSTQPCGWVHLASQRSWRATKLSDNSGAGLPFPSTARFRMDRGWLNVGIWTRSRSPGRAQSNIRNSRGWSC